MTAVGGFVRAKRGIEELAKLSGVPVGSFATTLAIALISDDVVSIGQVGDAIAILQDSHDQLSWIEPAPRYEYANETDFLTAPQGLDYLRMASKSESAVKSLALSTDGLRYRILDMPSRTPYQPFFEDIFTYARGADAKSGDVGKFIQGLGHAQTGDDKTLVIAVRKEGRWHELAEPPLVALNDVLLPAASSELPSDPMALDSDVRESSDLQSGAGSTVTPADERNPSAQP